MLRQQAGHVVITEVVIVIILPLGGLLRTGLGTRAARRGLQRAFRLATGIGIVHVLHRVNSGTGAARPGRSLWSGTTGSIRSEPAGLWRRLGDCPPLAGSTTSARDTARGTLGLVATQLLQLLTELVMRAPQITTQGLEVPML